MATLYDVCKKTGLSTATVSRVINESSAVTEKNTKNRAGCYEGARLPPQPGRTYVGW